MARRWEVAAKRASDGRSRDDWNTPHEIADLVTALFRGAVDLDPCGNPESVVPARVQYRFDEREENGLALPWQGTVFVNPPFAQLREFARKASEEYAAGRAKEIVFLMPSRTDTRAWHDFVATAGAICFWRGRLTFLGAPNPAPFPAALVYWGMCAGRFEEVFGKRGMCVRLP